MNCINNVLTKYFRCRSASGAILKIENPVKGSREILSCIFNGKAPQEIEDLYGFCDGFATVEREGVNWVLPKVGDLGDYMVVAKKWLSLTHPEIADNYYPFFNYDGNSIGYFKKNGNEFDDSLYLFTGDLYLNEESQPYSEFLCRMNENIRSYLEYEMKFY